jgi:hypothetical protein
MKKFHFYKTTMTIFGKFLTSFWCHRAM